MKTIAIDFDGVIHAHTSPFTKADEIHDDPVEGALEFIREAFRREYGVTIYTARASREDNEGVVEAIVRWLLTHGLEESYVEDIAITGTKPAAIVYIDDRGWRFEGTFPSFEEIAALRQWNKP